MSESYITYCDNDFKLSEEFVKVTLGLDNFYKLQQTSVKNEFLKTEGLVPVNLTKTTPYLINSFEEAIENYTRLYQKMNCIKNELRREYMAKQVTGMIAYIRYLNGEEHSFRQVVRNSLYVDSNPVPEIKINRIHEKLNLQLSEAGFKGSLVEKYRAYFEERKVNQDEMASVLTELLTEAKKDVESFMFKDISELNATPQLVNDVPFSAYADYSSRKMLINADYNYTYESLKHLVAHEVFPGHFTHLFRREKMMNEGKIPVDAGLVITNSASSPIFEGIADCGLTFLGWDETVYDEIAKTVQLLKMCTTLNASYLLNELSWSEEKVKAYLEEKAFGEESWIKSRVSFIKDFIRGPFIYAYHRGFETLHPIVSNVPKEEKHIFYSALYENMLTADELKLF